MTTSRFLCPLDCGWHHDQADPVPDPALVHVPRPTAELAGALLLGHARAVEVVLRAHLETHELTEWVKAVTGAQQRIATMEAEQERYEETVVGELNETNTRLSRQVASAEVELAENAGVMQALRRQRDEAEAQVARIRAFLEDMAGWCSPHGVAADYAQRGLAVLDGVDPLGVDTPAAQASEPTARELGESLGAAMDALLPRAEPVFCHHEGAQRSVHETHQAGWGRNIIVRLTCPACDAWAEQVGGEPVLAPKLLNVERCTDACAERHTVRPGCLLAPDFSKPILRRKP